MFHVKSRSITLSLALLGLILTLSTSVLACGYGSTGGADYVPQRQNPYAPSQPALAISAGQAGQLVKEQIGKLNPTLSIGAVNDAGGYYEVEVINASHEVVQILGVDKASSRLTLLD